MEKWDDACQSPEQMAVCESCTSAQGTRTTLQALQSQRAQRQSWLCCRTAQELQHRSRSAALWDSDSVGELPNLQFSRNQLPALR